MSLLLLFGGGEAPPGPTEGVTLEALGVRLLFEVSESAPFATTQVWHDLSGYIRGKDAMQTQRGRSHQFDEVRAGTLTLTLDASNGDLDPTNESSPHFDCLKARRRCRLRVIHNDVVYPVFHGFADGWPRTYNRPNIQGLISFSATDGSRVLSNADPTTGLFRLGDPVYGRLGVGRLGGGTAAVQLSGELIAGLADALGWPSNLRDIDEGRVVVNGDLGSRRGIAAMQEAAKAEGGDLYFARDGKLTHRDGLARYLDARSTVAQATFSPSKASPPSYDEPFRIENDDTRFVNEARYTGASGIPQIERDPVSIEANGISEDAQSLISLNDGDVKNLAVIRVADFAEPEDRVEQIVVRCRTSPDVTFPAVLGRELFDRVDVVIESTHGAPDQTLACVIQGIDHHITRTEWVTTFRMGPYKAHQFFTLGHATLGQLGGVGVLAP